MLGPVCTRLSSRRSTHGCSCHPNSGQTSSEVRYCWSSGRILGGNQHPSPRFIGSDPPTYAPHILVPPFPAMHALNLDDYHPQPPSSRIPAHRNSGVPYRKLAPACLFCRGRKIACDGKGKRQCQQCRRRGFECE
ncbi:hypothetical protein B0H14DRAFT_512370 [Mycena olivaceomarginata]|nr:hypothetical protein B0H14DRAFT_512370 [Mycena olivaceomarginata]